MDAKEDLNQYVGTYEEDPFWDENQRGLERYVQYCINHAVGRENYLELGIGHGVTLDTLSRHFKRVVVLEGASQLVEKFTGHYTNAIIREARFESFESSEKFDNIGMGFVLEHVDDPVSLLSRYRRFLSPGGSIFIGVPSASSMHRILAQKAGLLNDITQLSDADLHFGHKRYLTHEGWLDVITNAGLRLHGQAGLALKPFAAAQMRSLKLDPRVIDALDDLAAAYPELANGLFLEVKED